MRALLLAACLLATPALAQQDEHHPHFQVVSAEVDTGGPVAVGGSGEGLVVNLRGKFSVPVQVQTNCPQPTEAATIAVSVSPVDGGVVSLHLAGSDQAASSECAKAWLAKMEGATFLVPLVQGTISMEVSEGPLMGMKVRVKLADQPVGG